MPLGARPVAIPIENFPYGVQVDTLVLCTTREHMHKVRDAFQLKAEYQYGMPSLCGRRYMKVIAFTPDGSAHSEEYQRRWSKYVHEHLFTFLANRDAKIFIV
jgi:hypothetical protein